MTPQTIPGTNIVLLKERYAAMTKQALHPQDHSPLINEVEAYWDALRDGRSVPARADIDPRGLERALDHAFVIERQPGALARLRLSGQFLNRLMGMDLRSMPLHALFDPAERGALDTMIEQVFEAPQCLRLKLRGARDGQLLHGNMLLLPLRDDFGHITRALGVLDCTGDMTQTPCRLRIDAQQPRPLARPASPQYATPEDQDRAQGFAEMYEQFVQRKGPSASRPALRLIKSEE